MSCAINPRCGVSGQIQPVSENERKSHGDRWWSCGHDGGSDTGTERP